MNFQGREIFKGFSIDRLSQMTLVLDNSLFSQKITFKNDKMRSHECLYFLFFYLEHIQSNVFSLNFLLYSSFTAPPPNMENEQFLIE